MGNNKNSQASPQQEYSQATALADKVLKKEGCKDFRKFLNSLFSVQEMKDLPLTLGESKHQVTMWINEPSTMPFLPAVYFMDQWIVSIDYQSEQVKTERHLELLEQYEIGFDRMTLRHYHSIKQHRIGHCYSFEELLRQWAGSTKLLHYHLEELRTLLDCSKHQLSLWIKYPQTIPHREVVMIVHYLPNFTQYNQHRNGASLGYESKSLLEEDSLYTHFQLGFDTIPLRTVFKFLNQQKAID